MGKIIADTRKSHAVISNHHMWRADLSFHAKGILDFILPLPLDWKINESSLLAFSGKEGSAIRNCIEGIEYGSCFL